MLLYSRVEHELGLVSFLLKLVRSLTNLLDDFLRSRFLPRGHFLLQLEENFLSNASIALKICRTSSPILTGAYTASDNALRLKSGLATRDKKGNRVYSLRICYSEEGLSTAPWSGFLLSVAPFLSLLLP